MVCHRCDNRNDYASNVIISITVMLINMGVCLHVDSPSPHPDTMSCLAGLGQNAQ